MNPDSSSDQHPPRDDSRQPSDTKVQERLGTGPVPVTEPSAAPETTTAFPATGERAAPAAPVSAYDDARAPSSQPHGATGDAPTWQAPGGPAQVPPAMPPTGPAPMPGRGKLVAGALILALLAGGAGGLAGYALSGGASSTTVYTSPSVDAGAGMTYTEVAAKVSPSVVAIVAGNSEGSGVVYSADGYIVTNNHVVEGASTVQVRFADGTTAEGTVLATDPTQDLAVVQVDGALDLHPIELGDSDGLQVGDVAIAVGSPLGLEGTVTQGIVSAVNRSLTIGSGESQFGRGGNSATLDGLIQTDAAINMGNSGGALVNGSGELIGINTAIASTESGNIGLGFAIPSNTVKDVVDQLIEHGSVERGFLGVVVQDVQSGAMIIEVEDGSPAAEAGLRPGDVVTAIDGETVQGAAQVVAAIQGKAAGDPVSISYLRDGTEHSVETTLATR